MERIAAQTEKRNFVMAVWARVVLAIIGFIVVSIPLTFAVVLLQHKLAVLHGVYLEELQTLLSSVSLLISALLTTWLLRRYADRESYFSLGFNTSAFGKSLLLATAVVLGVMGLGTLLLVVTGSVSIHSNYISIISLLLYAAAFIFVAFTEEVLFRGYILGNLMKRYSRFVALLVSSLLFGLMHAMNPNVQVLPIVNIVLAGLLLGAAYIYTQNLWYPIVLHFMWNFLQGPILGYSVSGINTNSLFSVKPVSAAWISGGSFGFEGSAACTLLCSVAAVLIIWYYRRKNLKNQHV